MNNVLKSAAVATFLSIAAVDADAAQSDEIAEIRAQLEALVQRVDRLEQENVALKEQNAQLKAQAPTGSAPQVAKDAKEKSADWPNRVALKADLRYRYEATSDDTLNSAGVQNTADRYRDRVRARLSMDVKATDDISFGLGFATTEGGDPRASNQTLTNIFSRKSFELDLAYFDWKFSSWGHLLGGKMRQPFFKPGQSLFWDSDVNPEGLAASFSHGNYFGTAYYYWVNEVSGAQSSITADTMLYGGQIGTRLPLGESTLTLAAHYYDLSGAEGRAPFFNGNPYGNTTITVPSGSSTIAVLANDYQVVNLSAELNARLGELPLQVWADLAQNQDADDFDTAWTAGVTLGKASAARTWEIGAAYQVLEKDALFAQFIDGDFGGGVTDSKGFIFRGGYAPVRNWVLNATYFMTERNVDVANAVGQRGVDFDRLQLDFNVKF